MSARLTAQQISISATDALRLLAPLGVKVSVIRLHRLPCYDRYEGSGLFLEVTPNLRSRRRIFHWRIKNRTFIWVKAFDRVATIQVRCRDDS